MAVLTQPESTGGRPTYCILCKDSGKVDGAYCTCGAGKRLQTNESQQKAEGE